MRRHKLNYRNHPETFVGQLIYKYDKHGFPKRDAFAIVVDIKIERHMILAENLETGGVMPIAMEMFTQDFLYLEKRELQDELAEDEYAN